MVQIFGTDGKNNHKPIVIKNALIYLQRGFPIQVWLYFSKFDKDSNELKYF